MKLIQNDVFFLNVFLHDNSTFRLMKHTERAALSLRASPLFSPVLDREEIQTQAQSAVISRAQLPDITEK